MRHVNVYLRKGAILMHASSRTTDGVWILTGVCVKLPADTGDATVGAAVRARLAESQNGVPHPKIWKGLFDPVLEAAGVKSWGVFVRGASSVSIHETSEGLSVQPMRNQGTDGFRVMKEAVFGVPSPSSDESIGAALREGIRMSCVADAEPIRP
jgi:hypothetical protein